jgi:hypothetical protein
MGFKYLTKETLNCSKSCFNSNNLNKNISEKKNQIKSNTNIVVNLWLVNVKRFMLNENMKGLELSLLII